MASAISHVIAAAALGTAFREPSRPPRLLLLGAACSVLPDLDVIGFWFGIRYGDILGHRGLTHSLAFAAVLAALLTGVALGTGGWSVSGRAVWSYLFLATASHGMLDAMTNGGLGVAFFSPFDPSRYFFPFRPIDVSPIGFRAWFTREAFEVLPSEMVWIWMPASFFAILVAVVRRPPRLRERPSE